MVKLENRVIQRVVEGAGGLFSLEKSKPREEGGEWYQPSEDVSCGWASG